MAILIAILSLIGPLLEILMALFAKGQTLHGRDLARMQSVLNRFQKTIDLCHENGIEATTDDQAEGAIQADKE